MHPTNFNRKAKTNLTQFFMANFTFWIFFVLNILVLKIVLKYYIF